MVHPFTFPYKSFGFLPKILLFTYYLASQSQLLGSELEVAQEETCNAGIMTGHMALWNGKRLYFFGLHHDASTVEKRNQQINDLISSLHATDCDRTAEDPTYVLVEKETSFFHNSIFQSLEKAIEPAPGKKESVDCRKANDSLAPKKSALQNIILENVEIRQACSEADKRFKRPINFVVQETEPIYETFDDDTPPIIINCIPVMTFAQLLDDYDKQLQRITDFRAKFDKDDIRFKGFNRYLRASKLNHKYFCEQLSKMGLSKEDGIASSLERFLENNANGKEAVDRLRNYNEMMYAFLFDVHLFQKIYELPGNSIITIGGLMHTGFLHNQFTTELNGESGPGKTVSWGTLLDTPHTSLELLSKNDIDAILTGNPTSRFSRENLFNLISFTSGALLLLMILNIKAISSTQSDRANTDTSSLDKMKPKLLSLNMIDEQ